VRKPRKRYSLHVIQATGEPRPLDAIQKHGAAIDAAEITARETGLEVRVWDTRKGQCVYTAPMAVSR
jgi:hypothetical protein